MCIIQLYYEKNLVYVVIKLKKSLFKLYFGNFVNENIYDGKIINSNFARHIRWHWNIWIGQSLPLGSVTKLAQFLFGEIYLPDSVLWSILYLKDDVWLQSKIMCYEYGFTLDLAIAFLLFTLIEGWYSVPLYPLYKSNSSKRCFTEWFPKYFTYA